MLLSILLTLIFNFHWGFLFIVGYMTKNFIYLLFYFFFNLFYFYLTFIKKILNCRFQLSTDSFKPMSYFFIYLLSKFLLNCPFNCQLTACNLKRYFLIIFSYIIFNI